MKGTVCVMLVEGYCTVLYCTVLYCTVLYCTVLAEAIGSWGHGQLRPSAPGGPQVAQVVPRSALKAKSSPKIVVPHLPLCSTCQANDFWVQKWKSSSKTRFGLPKRVSGPKSRPKPSVITVSNALGSFWSKKCSHGATFAFRSVLDEKVVWIHQ